MRPLLLLSLFLSLGLGLLLTAQGQGLTSENNDPLRQGLKQFPQADTNKDGTLTAEEGRAFMAKMRSDKGKSSSAPSAADLAKNPPTFADVAYGPHERNKLDFWKADTDQPAPVIVFIHGGGFTSGDKSKVRSDATLTDALAAKVHFAAINYRYRTNTPIQDVLRDCARAIQFIRSKAGEWNIDKTRIASYGGSAGAGTSLWLAFHDDFADPQNADPVLRESSRLIAAGAYATQFSYDITKWADVLGVENGQYGDPEETWPAFYGLKSVDELRSPAGQKVCADCDMRGLISKDDPPVFLNTTSSGDPISNRGAFLHHPKHAKAIYDRCHEIGVPVEAILPAFNIKPTEGSPQTMSAFLISKLQAKPEPAATPAGS
jgi:acetyl esterase/lipase